MQLSFCICLKKKNVSRKNKDIIQNETMNNDTLEAHGRFDWGLRGENKVMEALLFHFLQRSAVKSLCISGTPVSLRIGSDREYVHLPT